MTPNEFSTWLQGLDAGDLSVVAGLLALVEGMDGGGVVRRGDWLRAAEQRLAQVAHDLGAAPADPARHPETATVVGVVEDRILPALEDAGVARRDVPGQGWSAVSLAAGLVPDDGEARVGLVDELAGTLERLEALRQGGYRIPEQAVAPETEGSRFYAKGLTKSFKRRRVVSEVDISVSQGQIVGLLGPNGAGKTTTFYMMVGLIPPDAGSVHLDDEVLTDTPMYKRARKGVGYLAQEPSIFRKLTVEENVLAILQTLRLSRREEEERLEQLLKELGLAGLRESKASELSGGERRRLEITRALVQRPKFMLLDEPFAGIDPIAVNDIQQIVRGLKSRSIGVIISDHNVEQTLEIVDRAYIMYEGRIRVSGTVSELVWNDEVADIYLGPSLTTRMRHRFPRPALV